MATHSNILAWKISRTKEPGRLYLVHGVKRLGHDRAHMHAIYKAHINIYFSMYTHAQINTLKHTQPSSGWGERGHISCPCSFCEQTSV